MSCTNTSQSPSAYEVLRETADAFTLLESTASKQQIVELYLSFRESLWRVIEGANNATAYNNAWVMVSRYGDDDLVELQRSPQSSLAYSNLLVHLKHLIQSAMDNLPFA